MMLSLSVNVFAAEPLTDDPNMIEWKYTVFADESLQKVVEEGVIPNAYARYTWRGITLKNGEVAILTPSNNSMGLYCNSGRYITINYTLSRSAFHRYRCGLPHLKDCYAASRNRRFGYSRFPDTTLHC